MSMYRSLAALAATAGLLFAAPTADAAVKRSFDIDTSPGIWDGTARAWGMATFRSGGRARITGRLNDRCPADGLGAYLDVYFHTNGYRSIFREFHFKDTQGCEDNDGIAFDVSVNANAPVSGIQVRLREDDPDGHRVGESEYVRIDNPNA
jgi:hypothetical protein